jgi:hypothetical protein
METDMEIDPDLCIDVPQGFDDSDAENQVHPMASKFFPAVTAAEAFRKAHEWVRDHDVLLADVSWDWQDDEDQPYVLRIYFRFEPEPEDDDEAQLTSS